MLGSPLAHAIAILFAPVGKSKVRKGQIYLKLCFMLELRNESYGLQACGLYSCVASSSDKVTPEKKPYGMASKEEL